MLGYKIKIHSLPTRVWACETTVEDYSWENRHTKDMLEIAISKYPQKTVTVNNQPFVLKNGDLSCVASDIPYTSACQTGDPINIVSVCVRIDAWDCTACDLSREDCFDKSIIFLPAFLENVPLSDELELLKLMHQIIKNAPDGSESARVLFLSHFFTLLHKADTVTRHILQQENTPITDMNHYYMKKIDYLIETRYSEKLSLHTVATALNLSAVYVSSLYKKQSGITFSEKLLQVRMRHAEAMLCNPNMPTSKIAALCGFCDESYFRKQFKRFFGINIKEYRVLKNGITLYHEKPLREHDSP